MNSNLERVCEEFIAYRDVIKETVWLGHSYVYPLCAYIYMVRNQEPDPERIRACRQILKEEQGVFSSFRARGSEVYAALLAVDADPEMKMYRASLAYEELRKYFHSGDMTANAAILMSDTDPAEYGVAAAETWDMFERMNREHRFLTSNEDVCFAYLLAEHVRRSEETEPEYILAEAEEIFQRMKQEISWHSNAMQTVSHALALCEGDPEEKCDRTMELFRGLREQGIKYSNDFEMAALAVMANIGAEISQIIIDMIDVDEFLRTQEGYQFFGMSGSMRLLNALMIVSAYSMSGTDEVLSTFFITIMIAIQRAEAAAAAASAA